MAILSTGNEIVDLHDDKRTLGESWGRIWDTNRPSLQTALEGLGYRVLDLGIAHDKFAFCRSAMLHSMFLIPHCPVSKSTSPRFKRALTLQI